LKKQPKIFEKWVTFRPDYFTPWSKKYTLQKLEYSNGYKKVLVKQSKRQLDPYIKQAKEDARQIENKNTSGNLSRNAKSKLRNALYLLKIISKPKTVYAKSTGKYFKFKLNFITLTIPYPAIHDDATYCAQALHPFLLYLKKNKGLNSYVWKAETQKNGMLHFHITTNIFIHWKSIANKWDKILSKLGHYDNGVNIPSPEQSASTQIKAVIREGEIVNYLADYIMKKQTDRRAVSCRIWSASNNLVNKKITMMAEGQEWYENSREAMFREVDKVSDGKWFQVYWHNQRAWKYRSHGLTGAYRDMILEVMKNESKIKKYVIE